MIISLWKADQMSKIEELKTSKQRMKDDMNKDRAQGEGAL